MVGGEVTQNRADGGSNAKIMRPVNRKLLHIGGKISRTRTIYLLRYRLAVLNTNAFTHACVSVCTRADNSIPKLALDVED